MVVMLACGLLLVAGIGLAWRWRASRLELPAWALDDPAGRADPLRALVWLLNVAILSGLLIGVLVIGPAGRLAMRLLAATSSQAAQGRITDADEVVGEITLNGTLAFFTFVGLPFGLIVGFLYAFTSFFLPRGPVGGGFFGAALLVVFGATVDPLRKENPDFDILDPGWLAVLTFGSMAVLTGLVIAPVAGRIGTRMSAPRLRWAAWLLPVGLVVLAALANAPLWVLFGALVACVVLVLALVVPPGRRTVIWRHGRRVVQVALVAVVAWGVPGFVSAVSSIS